jgi:hypothetical protein
MLDIPNALSRSAGGKPLEVFRHRPFLIFWNGACISNIGNWTENTTQSWAVTSQTIGKIGRDGGMVRDASAWCRRRF